MAETAKQSSGTNIPRNLQDQVSQIERGFPEGEELVGVFQAQRGPSFWWFLICPPLYLLREKTYFCLATNRRLCFHKTSSGMGFTPRIHGQECESYAYPDIVEAACWRPAGSIRHRLAFLLKSGERLVFQCPYRRKVAPGALDEGLVSYISWQVGETASVDIRPPSIEESRDAEAAADAPAAMLRPGARADLDPVGLSPRAGELRGTFASPWRAGCAVLPAVFIAPLLGFIAIMSAATGEGPSVGRVAPWAFVAFVWAIFGLLRLKQQARMDPRFRRVLVACIVVAALGLLYVLLGVAVAISEG